MSICLDSSSRGQDSSRPTRKRLATFENENNSELLRKYSSLSSKTNLNTYFQIQNPSLKQQQQQQSRNLVEFEPCLSVSSTNLSTNQTIQNSSPSTTSSSSVSSVSVTSFNHQQQQKQFALDSAGIPIKMIKSSVPSVTLHSAQSCYASNNNNTSQYYHQQNILYPTNQFHNGTSLDYRQTFTAFSSNNIYKQQASPTPPPPPYHSRSKDLTTISSRNNYENVSILTPPYVEYKKPPSYQESVHRIVSFFYCISVINNFLISVKNFYHIKQTYYMHEYP